MEIVKNCNLTRNGILENSIGLTDERASEHYILFQENVFGSLSEVKDNDKKTIKVNDMYLVSPKLQSEEFCIMQFYLARGNNSGGTFDMSTYLFRDSDYIVLTKVELYTASTYEWNGTLQSDKGNQSFTGTKTLDTPLKKSDNVKLVVPGSADYWGCRFYGYIFNPAWLGKNITAEQENYVNLVKQ